MKKKILGIVMALAMVLTMVPATVFAGTDQPPTKTSQDENVTIDGTTKNVEVDYTYLAESNTAEKVFNATIDYTFPATLDAKGAQNTYTWSPTDGKYTKDDTSTDASYTLSNEGKFEIKVTNHSNVDINYVVSYEAYEGAVFASALDGNMTTPTGTVNTIAKGQTVGAEEIAIADETEATTDKTGDFNNATCTGKLKVTGINEGENPYASGSDILGTFTIGISEATAELCKVELEEGSSLYRIAAIDEDGIVYYTPYVYTSGKFVYDTNYKGGCATMPSEYAVENFGNDYAAGDFFHEDEEGNLVKCISPESHGINDNLIKIEVIDDDGVTINYLFVLPETTYAYSNGKLSIIGVAEFGKSGYTCTLNGNPVPLSGELADGDYFKVVQEQNE